MAHSPIFRATTIFLLNNLSCPHSPRGHGPPDSYHSRRLTHTVARIHFLNDGMNVTSCLKLTMVSQFIQKPHFLNGYNTLHVMASSHIPYLHVFYFLSFPSLPSSFVFLSLFLYSIISLSFSLLFLHLLLLPFLKSLYTVHRTLMLCNANM